MRRNDRGWLMSITEQIEMRRLDAPLADKTVICRHVELYPPLARPVRYVLRRDRAATWPAEPPWCSDAEAGADVRRRLPGQDRTAIAHR